MGFPIVSQNGGDQCAFWCQAAVGWPGDDVRCEPGFSLFKIRSAKASAADSLASAVIPVPVPGICSTLPAEPISAEFEDWGFASFGHDFTMWFKKQIFADGRLGQQPGPTFPDVGNPIVSHRFVEFIGREAFRPLLQNIVNGHEVIRRYICGAIHGAIASQRSVS